MKAKIAIVGSGNIGWALKQLLKNDYDLKQGDIEDGFDANDISQVEDFLKGVDAVISAGPFAVNKNIASVAAENGIAYFDLTEDVETTEYIRLLKSENISRNDISIDNFSLLYLDGKIAKKTIGCPS